MQTKPNEITGKDNYSKTIIFLLTNKSGSFFLLSVTDNCFIQQAAMLMLSGTKVDSPIRLRVCDDSRIGFWAT
jgi:hypothetical protein